MNTRTEFAEAETETLIGDPDPISPGKPNSITPTKLPKGSFVASTPSSGF